LAGASVLSEYEDLDISRRELPPLPSVYERLHNTPGPGASA